MKMNPWRADRRVRRSFKTNTVAISDLRSQLVERRRIAPREWADTEVRRPIL